MDIHTPLPTLPPRPDVSQRLVFRRQKPPCSTFSDMTMKICNKYAWVVESASRRKKKQEQNKTKSDAGPQGQEPKVEVVLIPQDEAINAARKFRVFVFPPRRSSRCSLVQRVEVVCNKSVLLTFLLHILFVFTLALS
jgi:hypothetical protein